MAVQLLDKVRPAGGDPDDPRSVLAALAAFGMWGLLALYWKSLDGVPAYEQLCFRIIWAVLWLVPVLFVSGQWREVLGLVRRPRLVGALCVSTLCISVNWYLYIWAVSQNRVLDSSLGYYINPLMNTVLGYLVLKERFSRPQGIGIALAGIGVVWSVIGHGSLPVLALSMALSFSLYGLVRKLTPVAPVCGVFVETLLMMPVAAATLIYVYGGYGQAVGQSQALPSAVHMGLLALSGPFTLIPMLLFNFAARRVRLMVLGLAQFLSPTIAFFLSIFVFDETLSAHTLVTFVCIWAGLLVFSWASWRATHPVPRRL